MVSNSEEGAGSTGGAGFFGAGAGVPAEAFRAAKAAMVATDLAMIEVMLVSFMRCVLLGYVGVEVCRLPAGRLTSDTKQVPCQNRAALGNFLVTMDLFQPFQGTHEAADLLPGVGCAHSDAQTRGSPGHGGEADGRNEKSGLQQRFRGL